MGGAGRAGPALAMPDGNCSFGYENQVGGGAREATFPEEGVATAGREVRQ